MRKFCWNPYKKNEYCSSKSIGFGCYSYDCFHRFVCCLAGFSNRELEQRSGWNPLIIGLFCVTSLFFFRKKSTVLRPKKVVEFARLTSEARILISFFFRVRRLGVSQTNMFHLGPNRSPSKRLPCLVCLVNWPYLMETMSSSWVETSLLMLCVANWIVAVPWLFLFVPPKEWKAVDTYTSSTCSSIPKYSKIHKNIATRQSFRVLFFWRWSEMIMTLSFCVFLWCWLVFRISCQCKAYCRPR